MQVSTPAARVFAVAASRNPSPKHGGDTSEEEIIRAAFVKVKPVGPRPKRESDAARIGRHWGQAEVPVKTWQGEALDADIDGTYQRVAAPWPMLARCRQSAPIGMNQLVGLRRGNIPAGPHHLECRGARSTCRPPARSTVRSGHHHATRWTTSRQGPRGRAHAEGRLRHRLRVPTPCPRGAYVAGAGATSGPMSFMDIYDKMCFTGLR